MNNFLKIGALCMLLLGSVSSVDAKNQKVLVTTCFVTDLDCESCAAKIMNVLPYQKGVKDVVVDVAKKSVTVTYDSAKNSDKELTQSLSKLDVNILGGKDDGACEAGCCETTTPTQHTHNHTH